MSSRGASPIWNYLDDFWTCGPPSPNPHCRTSLDLMLGTCEHLGFTTNPAKTVLPTTNLILLGIELDSLAQEARIDQTRLAEVLHMLDKWSSRKHCTKRQLQSLIGKLHFISSVCRPGRTIVRRLIDLLSKASHPSHRIRLTVAFRKDIHWWQTFLTSWNGCSFFYQDYPILPWTFLLTPATQPLEHTSLANGFPVRFPLTAFPSPDPSPSRNFMQLLQRYQPGPLHWPLIT